MTPLTKHTLCPKALKDALVKLEQELAVSSGEKALHKVFKDSPDLCLAIGLALQMPAPDLYKNEFVLFGECRADIAIADSTQKKLVLVEFEDAKDDSIFKTTESGAKVWSQRLEHGFSQIVDWAFYLADMRRAHTLKKIVTFEPVKIELLLVIGRDAGMSEFDKTRLEWRSEYLIVDSKHVQHWTFDTLLGTLKAQSLRL